MEMEVINIKVCNNCGVDFNSEDEEQDYCSEYCEAFYHDELPSGA